jgi:hypothetical protein
MSGYVFHCTPCGKPHAGDCPPAKRITIAKTTVYPATGSLWRCEFQLPFSGKWFSPGPGWYYEVVLAAGDQVSYKLSAQNPTPPGGDPAKIYHLGVEAWTDQGEEVTGTSGGRIRMLPP